MRCSPGNDEVQIPARLRWRSLRVRPTLARGPASVALQSPRTPHEHIYVLPLMTILTNKVLVSVLPCSAPQQVSEGV